MIPLTMPLSRLSGEGFLASRREGHMIYYRLADDSSRKIVQVLYETFYNTVSVK